MEFTAKALKEARLALGLTEKQLAFKLGATNPEVVRRLEDPERLANSPLRLVLLAIKALKLDVGAISYKDLRRLTVVEATNTCKHTKTVSGHNQCAKCGYIFDTFVEYARNRGFPKDQWGLMIELVTDVRTGLPMGTAAEGRALAAATGE